MANTNTGSNGALIARAALGGLFGLLNTLADAKVITSENIGHIHAGFGNGMGVGSGDAENERLLADHVKVNLASLEERVRTAGANPADRQS